MHTPKRIHEAKKLECKRCGLCCKELDTIVLFGKELLLFEDIRRNARETSVIHGDTGKIYVLKLKSGGCPRYEMDKGCTTYDTRPLVCGAFPMAASHYQNGFGFMSLDSHLCTATIEFLEGSHDAIFFKDAIFSSSFLSQIVENSRKILKRATGRGIDMDTIPTTLALANEIEKIRKIKGP